MTRVSIEPEKLTAIHVKNQLQCVLNQQCDNMTCLKMHLKNLGSQKTYFPLKNATYIIEE